MQRRPRLLSQAAAIVAVCSTLALAGALVWLRLSGPSDGARLKIEERPWRDDGVVVSPVQGRPGSLRRGDLVVAMDGRSLEDWARALVATSAAGAPQQIGQTVRYTVVRDGSAGEVAVTLGRYPLRGLLGQAWGALLAGLVFQLLAGVVFLQRPADAATRLLLFAGTGIACLNVWTFLPQLGDLADATIFWLTRAAALAAFTLVWIAAVGCWRGFAPPPISVAARRLSPALYAAPALAQAAAFLWPASSTLGRLGRWDGTLLLLGLGAGGLTLASLLLGYRATVGVVARRRVRAVVVAALLFGGFALTFGMLPVVAVGHPAIDRNVLSLGALPVLSTLALAIWRHHLFDVDLVVSRALVYGGLTASVVGLYVLVVGGLGALFHGRGNLVISLLATGLVAVLFQHLRDRLQRAVNRLCYGDRDDPYAVVSRLGRRLEATSASDAMLLAIVETVAHALKLPYAAISLLEDGAVATTAASGTPAGVPLILPLHAAGGPIGRLTLCPRAPGEAFTAADRRLLEALARQVELAAQAVRLTAELQRSRERLVMAREEERRRLRRDLHDDLGPTLASLTLKIDDARERLGDDPDAADAALDELKRRLKGVVVEVRRLAYDLRPPTLDEFGLTAALQDHAALHQTDGLRISVVAPERFPPLPAAIEVAAYRIAVEAVSNVARHARARTCRVRLSITDAFAVEVVDDGTGLPAAVKWGVGVASMRERAAELGGSCLVEGLDGGGTRVLARLPLPTGGETNGTDARVDR